MKALQPMIAIRPFYAFFFFLLAQSGFSQQALSPKTADSLRKVLTRVAIEDQRYRDKMSAMSQQSGPETPEMQALVDSMRITDARDLKIVKSILNKYGWIGADQIGEEANHALFLVILHADLATQKKYLPMLKQAVAGGKAREANLGMLEDRMAVRQGKPQTYGSQVSWDKQSGRYYLLPIVDPDKVNERRAKIGMTPIEDYLLDCCNLVWDAASYKKDIHSLKTKKN